MSEFSDYLIRGLVTKKNFRFTFIETTATVAKGILTHNLDPVSALVFGRALTTTGLVAPLLEGDEKYSFRWNYKGRLNSVVTDVNSNSDLRGIISEHNLIQLVESEEEIYGLEGQVSVIKSCNGQILNSGMAKAGLLDVVDDIAFFFSTSDQLETEMTALIAFNSDPADPVGVSTGFMIQAMPDCDLKEFEVLRMNMKCSEFNDILVDTRIQEEKKLWKLMEVVLGKPYDTISDELQVKYTFAPSPSYTCNCSIDKMKLAVKTLGEDDIKTILDESGTININCEFCNTKYCFRRDEIN